MGFISRVRSIFRLFVLLTVLMAVALLSAITTIRITIHSGEEKAPNLVGLPMEQAQRLAGGMGLGVKVEDHLFNSKYAENHIVSQEPAAGASTKTGQDIHVLVSLGTPSVTVPRLVGDSVRAAQVTAVQRGLTLGDIASVHWSGALADSVVAQDPLPSAQPARSPAVNLLVSLGDPSPEFVCPSFVGMTIGQARSELARAGFSVGEVKAPAPAPVPAPAGGAPGEAAAPGVTTAPNGTILSQSPAPGTKIEGGAAFTFTVAP
ncbi:MAG TPA: PASTA domain-containing protein [Terriglobia bacterium]